MSNQGVVPVVTNICMVDPVQNQQTRFFSGRSSVVSSLPDHDIQAQCFKIGCSFCSWPEMLAFLGVKINICGFFLARSSVVRFV